MDGCGLSIPGPSRLLDEETVAFAAAAITLLTMVMACVPGWTGHRAVRMIPLVLEAGGPMARRTFDAAPRTIRICRRAQPGRPPSISAA
jgi:hypothetical protein